MERKSIDINHSAKHIKLPTIQHRKVDSSRIMSSTMPENSRIRPASLQKVENLEKKLFDKLDSYDSVVRKGGRKVSKKSTGGQSFGQTPLEGYEKMQKLMPGLYSKLVEAKRGTISDTVIPSDNENMITQPKMKKLSSSSEESKAIPKRYSQKNSEVQHEEMVMTSEELEQMYREYSKQEQLKPQTSSRELHAMNESLLLCEKQIAGLTHSMEALISQIGRECLLSVEGQQ